MPIVMYLHATTITPINPPPLRLLTVLSILCHNFIDSRRREEKEEGNEQQADSQGRQTNNTHTHTRTRVSIRVSAAAAYFLAHCQCIQRDYFAVYFARISQKAERERERGSWLGRTPY